MKYIRTKTDIYDEEWFDELCKKNLHTKDEIVKIADSVEQVCDLFVAVNSDETKDIYKYLTGSIREMAQKKIYIQELFGAIWTKEGLTYVVKLIENGEWKLV